MTGRRSSASSTLGITATDMATTMATGTATTTGTTNLYLRGATTEIASAASEKGAALASFTG